jgi:hypothetical protein
MPGMGGFGGMGPAGFGPSMPFGGFNPMMMNMNPAAMMQMQAASMGMPGASPSAMMAPGGPVMALAAGGTGAPTRDKDTKEVVKVRTERPRVPRFRPCNSWHCREPWQGRGVLVHLPLRSSR